VPTPPPTPVETFASFIRGLTEATAAMGDGDRLSSALIALIELIALIVTRLREIGSASPGSPPASSPAHVPRPALPAHAARPPPADHGRRASSQRKSAGCCRWYRTRADTARTSITCIGTRRWPRCSPQRLPPVPELLQDRRKPWSLARIRGSPHRA